MWQHRFSFFSSEGHGSRPVTGPSGPYQLRETNRAYQRLKLCDPETHSSAEVNEAMLGFAAAIKNENRILRGQNSRFRRLARHWRTAFCMSAFVHGLLVFWKVVSQ